MSSDFRRRWRMRTSSSNSVISDLIGVTGRAMLAALIAGETDPGKLAALAHPRIKAPPEQLREG